MKHHLKKRLKRSLLGLSIFTILASTWHLTSIGRQLEQDTLDFRYREWNRDQSASDQVVVIDIDEQSIKNLEPSYGRWPWPRRVYKDMIEFLSLGEPSLILFDILFSETQRGTDDDLILGQVSKETGIVSHALQFLVESSIEDKDHISLPPIEGKFRLDWKAPPKTWVSQQDYHDFLLPNPTLLKEIPLIHSVNVHIDGDGFLRRTPALFMYDKTWVPSLSLLGLLAHEKWPTVTLEKNHLQLLGERTLSLPLDQQRELPLHFYSQGKQPKSFRFGLLIDSALMLQKGEVEDPSQLPLNPLDFEGKVILIGTSATGLNDLKITPISRHYPGVLLHATAISNVLQQSFLKPLPRYFHIFATILLLLLIYACVLMRQNIFLQIGGPLFLLGTYFYTSCWLFQSQSLHLELAMPLLLGFLALTDSFVYISFVEGRERKKLTGTLSKYLSPTVTQQLIESGIDPSAEVGQHKELSILFSDIRDFTTLSEKLEPGVLVKILNQYLGRMTDVIFEHGGTLDKFIGDAIMAFWGAPVENPNQALSSVESAFAMRKSLVALNQEWKDLNLQFQIGLGINTGRAIVGNIGSSKRLDYTVIGDNVNLASRIEGLTKQYQLEILIGERTEELIRKDILCRPIDLVKVKGKDHAVQMFEPLETHREANDLQKKLAENFNQAWEKYRQGDFAAAEAGFQETNLIFPQGDGPSRIYVERCQELKLNPPKLWDGVFIAKSK